MTDTAHQKEIAALQRIIAWCRPRLSRDSYRKTLDRYVSRPATEADIDHAPMVQSTIEANIDLIIRKACVADQSSCGYPECICTRIPGIVRAAIAAMEQK